MDLFELREKGLPFHFNSTGGFRCCQSFGHKRRVCLYALASIFIARSFFIVLRFFGGIILADRDLLCQTDLELANQARLRTVILIFHVSKHLNEL